MARTKTKKVVVRSATSKSKKDLSPNWEGSTEFCVLVSVPLSLLTSRQLDSLHFLASLRLFLNLPVPPKLPRSLKSLVQKKRL